MKLLSVLFLLATFSAQASPFMSVKERLRLHLWTFGLEDRPLVPAQQKKKVPQKVLPEEIERPLRKM
ncbi:MAG: hypothetical protein ACLGHN_07065 [Bacteriovoracia bacterium]